MGTELIMLYLVDISLCLYTGEFKDLLFKKLSVVDPDDGAP
jgi:hypothetical protein|tara:strand:+ start:244 stop:366 length:123 start_codon:yes stop_codon:yes gene_type:complete